MEAIRKLEAQTFCRCVAIIVGDGAGRPVEPARRNGLNRHWLYNLYFRRVTRRCGAMARARLRDAVPHAPSLSVQTTSLPRGRTGIADESFGAIADLDLDFAVRFGFGILSGPILDLPRFGVWSFHHGDPEKFRGQPPGLWEIIEGAAVTGAAVQRLGERLDAGQLLAIARLPTIRGSYTRQLDQLLRVPSGLLAQVARHCALHGELPTLPVETSGPIYRKPGPWDTIRLLLRLLQGRLGNIARSMLRYQQWNVAVARAPIGAIIDGGLDQRLDRLAAKARCLPEEKDHFDADPFFFPPGAGGTLGLVFERLDLRNGRGFIASCVMDDAGGFSPVRPLIETGSHLSYPFVFRRGGDARVLPEAAEGGRLVEYAADLPTATSRPVHDHGSAVLDPTIVQHDGRYWMFYGGDDANTTLCIRHARSLDGPWSEHEANPVKIDVTNARPAGPVIEHDGSLYRPAQVCVPDYGQGIVFNRIVRLDRREYREEPVASLLPALTGRYRDGVHTIAAEGDYIVFDHARAAFSRHEFVRQVAHKVRRLGTRTRG
ncbi:hypothetical protein J4558_09310 [Leptolyngbya sp. 15MV]|nr:hypothetical protein J4558_09310 [Leptolyngbya sp. 15MV]